ncbi:adenosine deaminase [Vibrio sp. SS-MA-C1-2]|uniref:adenosine deaminase n=1 Tax=Vibrio sp. SS-MA-C1-2 TaxID=2908646 RepID=UPI001F1AB29C|nr:adenosine deaminase [Vibrio sp. SS-MA-C1-2]UJF18332.1 adenosine deaminase [Vibrio sp. SS-MA-C1-2]
MNYFNLPKIDLHCHLDGSVRPQTIIDLAIQHKISLPSYDLATVTSLLIAPETCPDLDTYLQKFDTPLLVMQTAVDLERISFELFEDAALENVKYLEVRFAPLLHLQQGLTLEQVISSVLQGMDRATKQYDIEGNYILCAVKNMPNDNINKLLEAGSHFLSKGVVAFDLAGSEVAGFASEYIPFTQYAKELGYKITIHAGEQGVGQNVYDAITELGAERIGHGIHISGYQPAYDLVKDKRIGLETCPSSNIQTKAVESLASHPCANFYNDGLAITINSDNRTVSNTTMTDEVKKVCEQFSFTHEDYQIIYTNSIEQCFADESVKKRLRTKWKYSN